MIQLPEIFTERMQGLLGEEYPAFLDSYRETRRYGLRVNTLKISPEEFEGISDFHLTPVEFIPGAYYYTEEDGAARHPFYQAGMYYLQEPSAMTPASVLPIQPGDRVLDLCAAPGGKATALGAKMQGQGLLVANDISASRCKALLKNIEVFGIPNALVTNEVPAKLADKFPEFFDAILVDAPCSGEGMFRKDEATVKAWYPDKPAECAKIQQEIVRQAVRMLRPGGRLLYSTCTFATVEDEEMIRFVLDTFPDMHLLDIPERPGFAPGLMGLTQCVRLWPHRTGGEGHFLALMEKEGGIAGSGLRPAASPKTVDKILNAYGSPAQDDRSSGKKISREKGRRRRGEEAQYGKIGGYKEGGSKDQRGKRSAGRPAQQLTEREKAALLREFFEETGLQLPVNAGRLEIRGDMAFIVPDAVPAAFGGLVFLRNGLRLGEFHGNRFEPSQALAMAMIPEEGLNGCLCFRPDDERIRQYLRGETVSLTSEEAQMHHGWVLVCADRYPLGWAKAAGNVLKNKYLAGWRINF